MQSGTDKTVTRVLTGAMTRQQRLVLTVATLASFVAFLDGSVITVALPAISDDLGGGLTTQQWVVDAYLITLGALILVAGSLSDLFGRVAIIRVGLWGFGVTSILCAVAPTDLVLILARGAQGIAGALLVPSSLALIMSNFRGAAQGKAIGHWTAWTSVAFIAGPLIGGLLVDLVSWRFVFAINVVPIAVTVWLLARLETKSSRIPGARVDVTGAVLATVGVGAPVFALIEQDNFGWSSAVILLPMVVGVCALAGFVWWESRAPKPMMPLGLFANRNFAWGNLSTLFVYAALSMSGFLVTVYLQQSAGFSATVAGLASLPVTVIMIALSAWFGSLAGKHGPRLFMSVGPLVAAAGHVLMLSVAEDLNYWTQLLPGIVVFGLGLAITVAPLTAAILGAIEPAQAGIASAVNNAIARVAGLVAIAALGVVVASSLDLEGLHRGFVVTAVLLAAGGLIAAIGIRNPAGTEAGRGPQR